MNTKLIFYPVLAHIFLVFWMYLRLAQRKKRALREKRVDLERRALFEDAWSTDVIQVNNNLRNQFQLPMLFYALSFMLWAMHTVNAWVLSLCVLFVVSRYVHALVHTGSNTVLVRFRAFLFGALMILMLAVTALLSLLMQTI